MQWIKAKFKPDSSRQVIISEKENCYTVAWWDKKKELWKPDISLMANGKYPEIEQFKVLWWTDIIPPYDT